MNKGKTTAAEEFGRVYSMLSRLSANFSVLLMTSEKIREFEDLAKKDQLMRSLVRELRQHLRSINGPEDYVSMSQAYEAYAEANFCLEMARRGVSLERTPGTASDRNKRPDFLYRHATGDIYFEVKALEIENPLFRHKEIAYAGLEAAADLDTRSRKPGIHFGETVFSGSAPSTSTSERIDLTITRIKNTIKPEQLLYGPTILVVDLGQLPVMPFGPSNLLPVFFNEGPPAESCVSGELWHIAVGASGERIFVLPEFEGASNLGGHLTMSGVLLERRELVGISFVLPSWSNSAEIFTIWNMAADQSALQNKLTVSEQDIAELLKRVSDGVNDTNNECGDEFLRRK